MGQIVSIDYGKKRIGLAATDDFQLVASGLDTVETSEIFNYLDKYFSENQVEAIVMGLPTDLRGNMSEIETDIQEFINQFHKKYPYIEIHRMDERFTSKMASFFISQSGKSKKQRQDKGLIDKISATILLQNFLEQKNR